MSDLVEVTVKTGVFNQRTENSRRGVQKRPGDKPFLVSDATQRAFKDVLQKTSDLAEPEAAKAVDESEQLDEAEKREAARRAMEAEDQQSDEPEPAELEATASSDSEDKKKESVTNEPNKAKGRKRPTRN